LSRLRFDSELFGIEEARIEPLVTPGWLGPVDDAILDQSSHLFTRVLAEAAERGVEHITAPVSAQDVFTQIALQNAGFTMSDTTLIHELDLQRGHPIPVNRSIRAACEDDIEDLSQIAESCFGDRGNNVNRFNSDPAYPSAAVASLYRIWVTKSVRRELADDVFVYEVDGQPAGFITMSAGTSPTAREARRGQIPLNAVSPRHQRRGIYSALVQASLGWMLARSVDKVEIRTQLPNLAVHRTWQRLGATILYGAHTFRWARPRQK
jgi:GNAT superfamily N-acetyltransferase